MKPLPKKSYRLHIAFAFFIAALAAYGAISLSKLILRDPHDPIPPLIGVVVFVAALPLMLKGIDYLGDEHFRAWQEEGKKERGRAMTGDPETDQAISEAYFSMAPEAFAKWYEAYTGKPLPP